MLRMGSESAPETQPRDDGRSHSILSEGGSLDGGISLLDLCKQKAKEMAQACLYTRGLLMFFSPGVVLSFT